MKILTPFFFLLMFSTALTTSCTKSDRAGRTDSTALADSLILDVPLEGNDSDGGPGDLSAMPEGFDPIIWQLYPSDSTQAGEYKKEIMNGALLTFSQGSSSIWIDATVGLVTMRNTDGDDGPYQNYCPTLAIFLNSSEGSGKLYTSIDLDCFTNYDDSMTDLSMSLVNTGNDVAFIGISANNKGYSGESEESNTTLILYAVVDEQLMPIWTGTISKSVSDGDESADASATLTFSGRKEGEMPDLIYTLTEGETTQEDTYVWNGASYVKR